MPPRVCLLRLVVPITRNSWRNRLTLRFHMAPGNCVSSFLGRYAKRNGNFVLVGDMSGDLETYGQHELIQVINDALIETIEL